MEIRKIGVVGAGQMGSGIAQVAAQAGYEVVLRDVEQRFLERGLAGIQRSLGKLLEKGRLTQKQYDAALANLKTTLTLEALEDCDLIVEAIVENEATKAELFRELDTLVQPGAILASNTSSIPITRHAA